MGPTAESLESARRHARRWIKGAGVAYPASVYVESRDSWHGYILGIVLREVGR